MDVKKELRQEMIKDPEFYTHFIGAFKMAPFKFRTHLAECGIEYTPDQLQDLALLYEEVLSTL
tara:strand:- start:65 stop:253 length:189 start_codon:yes stop_codon:yes gene_type:complete